MLRFIRIFYALISPGQARAIRHNLHLGLAIGKHAELVIAQPLEALFGEPLAAVRNKLRIPRSGALGRDGEPPELRRGLPHGRSKPGA